VRYLRENKKKLCSELYYQVVVDVFAHLDPDAQDLNNLGNKFILPATFQGSTCDMQENMQNSLAILGWVGVADLFLTMIVNPKCAEMMRELLPGQAIQERPDLVS
jgi:Helitron helicase-like domain at N-terminus